MSRVPSVRCALAVVLVASVLPSCGGGGNRTTGSTSVTTPPTTTLAPVAAPTAIDGITGAAVAATFSPAAPARSATVQATASGYLVREQPFEGTAIALWPSALPYVDELVYDWEFSDGSFRMVRWDRPFIVTLDGDLATDSQVVAKTREVLTEIGRVTGMQLTIGAGGPVLIRIDPSVSDDDAVASAEVEFRGATAQGAEVRFVTRQEITGGPGSRYRNTLLHEMGHVMGLGHSPSPNDVMTPGAGPGTRVAEYQPDEATCLGMMYRHRRPGNFLPDRDPALGARAVGEWRVRILD
jgi:hypothetical protein